MREAFNMPETHGMPGLDQAQAGEDMDPASNLKQLQSTMGMRDMQSPKQQKILQEEQARLMDLRMKQQFSQRLQQRLNPRIGTPEDTDPQAAQTAFMTRLMMQMRQGR